MHMSFFCCIFAADLRKALPPTHLTRICRSTDIQPPLTGTTILPRCNVEVLSAQLAE